MNILRKFFDKFKKTEEPKKDEVWFNEYAQRGEIHVEKPLEESALSSPGAYEKALVENATNSSC